MHLGEDLRREPCARRFETRLHQRFIHVGVQLVEVGHSLQLKKLTRVIY